MAFLYGFGLYMSCHIADTVFPFDSGVRGTHTVLSGGIFSDSLAALALINDWVTAASVKITSSLGHEDALSALFYRCTNHDNHILSSENSKKTNQLVRNLERP